METNDLIDRIVNYYENTSVTDAYNDRRRKRILEWTQEVVDDFWHYRPWSWRMATTTVTVSANATSAALPADFGEISPRGGVYDSSGNRLEEVSAKQIQDAIAETVVGVPRIFAIFTATAGVRNIMVPKVGSSSAALTIYYAKIPPTLADLTGATNNLDDIPPDYHFSVILPGVKAKAARSHGDARANELEGIYQRGLNRASTEEKGRRSSTRRLPRAVSERMW
jgi:hypothetical protein